MIPNSAVCSTSEPEAVRRSFLEHGFVVFRGFLSPAAVAEARSSVDAFVAHIPARVHEGSLPAAHVMLDDTSRPSTLKQVQQLHTHDQYCASLARSLQELGVVVLGEPCTLQNMQYFNKPPRSAYGDGAVDCSRPTPPHQDGFYWMHERGVTMWVALDDADEENGCIR